MSELTSVAESGIAGYQVAAQVTEIPSGWVLKVTVGGRDLALANREGTIHALDNSCTHAAGPLGGTKLTPDCLVECPWHNSQFDPRTGEVVRGPARKPVKTYEVLIQDGMVYVRLA